MFNTQGAGVEQARLERMIDQLRHRGPDGSGTHRDAHVGLAHTRLSIIDIEGGRQPMTNEDGTLWLVFNGEIFNYLELRDLLLKRGHRFATRSDTEVILHLYEDEGDACVERLNGQWAFALWDSTRRRLLLSRDRMGIRPLYYTRAGSDLLFASEVKALFADPAVERGLDLRALDQVFTFWSALAPSSVFKEVHEVRPGHNLVVEDGRLRERPYWSIDYSDNGGALTEADYAERLLDLLIDATRLRLRADVPVGAYLSGGLDSSIITALVSRIGKTSLKSFSLTFQDAEFDESGYQAEVVRQLGTEHQSVAVGYEDIGRVFPDVIWHAESPVIRTAPAPLYLLSGLVRRNGYKVVLSGEGSDEVLGGYDIFKEAKVRRFWGAIPDSRLRPMLLRRLYPYLPGLQRQSPAYLQAFFHVRPEDLSSPFFSHLPRWALTSRIKDLFSDGVRAELDGYDPRVELRESLPPAFHAWNSFCQAQYLETTQLLPGYLLSSQGDRMSMGHSVEGRFPFLDHRVVEFAATIPPRLKMKVLNEKYILKRAAGHLVPEAVSRRPKQPYRAPDAPSFVQGPAREWLREILSPDQVRRDGLFDPGAVERLVAKAESGRLVGIKDNMALVGIVSTQLLMNQFVGAFGRMTRDAEL